MAPDPALVHRVRLGVIARLSDRIAAYPHVPPCPCLERAPLAYCDCHIGHMLQLLKAEQIKAEHAEAEG